MHDHEETPVGRILSRREALSLLGVGGAGFLIGCRANSTSNTSGAVQSQESNPLGFDCVAKPEMTEGPFYFDTQLDRSDIRIDTSDGSVRNGVPLALTFAISKIADGACNPLPNAIVDIWHCDAQGAYSGYDREGTGGQTFLRGFQRTDEYGEARFTTIYPGWYRGRTTHIHVKVRTGVDDEAYEFTSQVYFDDAVSDEVFATEHYTRGSERDRNNDNDGIFGGGGNLLLLALAPENEGYTGRISIALDLSDNDIGAPDGLSRGRRG